MDRHVQKIITIKHITALLFPVTVPWKPRLLRHKMTSLLPSCGQCRKNWPDLRYNACRIHKTDTNAYRFSCVHFSLLCNLKSLCSFYRKYLLKLFPHKYVCVSSSDLHNSHVAIVLLDVRWSGVNCNVKCNWVPVLRLRFAQKCHFNDNYKLC